MSIGIAIIGTGIFVQEEHLPAVKATKHLALKAIYSRSLKSAKALNAGSVELYSDDAGSGNTYHDLLLRPDIHAVIIALPIMNQPEYIEAALAAGKHVLSEKPIAQDMKHAEHLMHFYKSDKVKGNATWGVAENFRFLESFAFGRQEIAKLGKVLGFRVKSFQCTKQGSKYYETEWRKTPTHQGGFLLDGGIHDVTGIRWLLGDSVILTALSAYTTLLQAHLPPVDTINSIWLTKPGVSGTFAQSFGTTLSGKEFEVACEMGSVKIVGNKVIVRQGEESEGKFEETEFKDEGSGVTPEVAAWAEGLAAGKQDPRQAPEQAFADLEIMEKMLSSGEGHGKSESLHFQV